MSAVHPTAPEEVTMTTQLTRNGDGGGGGGTGGG
jgi:hypothetical protein